MSEIALDVAPGIHDVDRPVPEGARKDIDLWTG